MSELAKQLLDLVEKGEYSSDSFGSLYYTEGWAKSPDKDIFTNLWNFMAAQKESYVTTEQSICSQKLRGTIL